jgi:hypothetical protein
MYARHRVKKKSLNYTMLLTFFLTSFDSVDNCRPGYSENYGFWTINIFAEYFSAQ